MVEYYERRREYGKALRENNALDAQYQKALETLVKLHQINPNFPGAADLKCQLEQVK